MGGVVAQDKALTVGAAAALHDRAVSGRGRGALEGEHDVLVEHGEVAARAVGYLLAVETFGHEDETPLHLVRAVDEVFHGLGRKPLAEVLAQAIDPRGVQLVARCAVRTGRVVSAVTRLNDPMGQHLAEVAPDSSRRGGHPAEVHPVALVAGGGAAGLGARIADDERRVFAEKNIPHIAPLAEIVAIGRGGDLTGRLGRRAVSGRSALAVGRKEFRDAVADFVPGLPIARRAENLHALGPEDHIRRGVVKRKIQHQLDSALIGREGKIPESGHRCGVVGRIRRGVVQIAVVAAGVEGIDLPEVADRVRTARIVGLVVVGRIGLASFQPLRMEWLEPDPVDPEIL